MSKNCSICKIDLGKVVEPVSLDILRIKLCVPCFRKLSNEVHIRVCEKNRTNSEYYKDLLLMDTEISNEPEINRKPSFTKLPTSADKGKKC